MQDEMSVVFVVEVSLLARRSSSAGVMASRLASQANGTPMSDMTSIDCASTMPGVMNR